jgi:predicted DNA-binding transcriptional regulator YafY
MTAKKIDVTEGLSKEVEYKLRIFDEKLAEKAQIGGVKELTDLLNRNRLPNDKRIGESRTKQIVEILKRLVSEDTNGTVKIKVTKNGYYYSEAESRKPVTYRLFRDFIHRDEENLLFMAKSFFDMFPGTALNENYSVAVDKILKTKSSRGEIKKLKDLNLIEVGGNNIDRGIQWVKDLIEAMIEKKAVKIEYKKDNEEKAKTKVLSPYILKKHESKWFLVAYDHTSKYDQKTNVFTLSKIQAVYNSDSRFVDDAYFSAKDYFNYSIGIWHSHIDKPVKVQIQVIDKVLFPTLKNEPIHHTQKIISEDQGTIEIQVYYTPELEKLVLKYGAAIKILSPTKLADWAKETFKKAFELYS